MIDQEKIKKAARLLLEGIGEDPDREGLKDTPERIARMCQEIFAGDDQDPAVHLSRVFEADRAEIVLERNIEFYSVCEHHLLPFYGKVHIAYIPDGKVVGISKLSRVTEVFARRAQIQERMTGQIADSIMKELSPKGVMVVSEARHMCMMMRGVKKQEADLVSISARGAFENNLELQAQVLSLIRGTDGNADE